MVDESKILASFFAECKTDPLKFVKLAFPWGEGELIGQEGPDVWQVEVLKYIRDNVGDISKAIKVAAASGHGVGKSALVSWLILWAMSTTVDCKGVVTANTETQLRTKTWPELAKWYRSFIGKHLFVFTATALFSSDRSHEKTWRVDAVPWSANNTEAFAGLHNNGRRILCIFDEASAIDDVIWEVTEGAMTDKNTSILWMCFGNPTRSTGRFADCFGRLKHRWHTYTIDSSKCKMSNKEQIAEWREDYGEDSDFYRVRVLGKFPRIGSGAMFSVEVLDEAFKKKAEKTLYEEMPIILGVDPAFDGGDFTVIFMRQGIYAKKVYEQARTDNWGQLAAKLMELEDKYSAQAVFIDKGYGTGLYSFGKVSGRDWKMVSFAEKATKHDLYQNKRAEMYYEMKDWFDNGACVDFTPDLREEILSTSSFLNAGGKLQLIRKDDIKAMLSGRSPNCADALALTFAYPVRPKGLKTKMMMMRKKGLIGKAGTM